MNGLEILRAICSPKTGKAPDLNKLENQLQPLGATTRNIPGWRLVIGAVIAAVVGLIVLRRAVPVINELVPQALSKLPSDMQWGVIFISVLVLAMGLGYGAYMISAKLSRRRALAYYIQSIQEAKKLMVYVSGSGAIGFSKAVERITEGRPIKELLVFAHPPAVAMKKGSIKLMGAITAFAPVQHAQGSHKAARAARGAESEKFRQAHSSFIEATGSNETAVEWSVIHLGKGHTSISCHTEWEDARSTIGHGARPKRFVILVRDADDQDQLLLEGLSKGTTKDTNTTEGDQFKPYTQCVVRVSGNGISGSGVLIDPDGLILTNAHVVEGAENVKVRFSDGSESDASIEEINPVIDYAVLNCANVSGAPTVQYGDSSALSVGDQIIALGYPGTSGYEAPPVGNTGYVSRFFLKNDVTHIQSDAAIVPGYSGGPLMTIDGKFVGMVTSTHLDPATGTERTIAMASDDIFALITKSCTDNAPCEIAGTPSNLI